MRTVIVGIGNDFRRDDGVGIIVAKELANQSLDVDILISDGEPTGLLEAWRGAELVIVIDAVLDPDLEPGSVVRWTPENFTHSEALSSHGLGLRQTYLLGQAIGRFPEALVGFGVSVADTRPGLGLTPAVAAAVPAAVHSILAELVR